uniref:Uncharacterized protein n=1 Tax=Anguilla anguilla TaxID=7936 RepID=A0A0E9W0G7_ANGAN
MHNVQLIMRSALTTERAVQAERRTEN